MFFRRKRTPDIENQSTGADRTARQDAIADGPSSGKQPTTSTAETAHLVGPGCIKLQGQVPLWQPVAGQRMFLHPQYLRRVFCYGNVDITTATLRLFWRRGIQVAFLSSSGHALVGRLQPGGTSPNLQRLQHLAAADLPFRTDRAREIVLDKIESTQTTARYFQQQGKGQNSGELISQLKRLASEATHARSIGTLLGIEGSVAAAWFRFFATVLPDDWRFTKRISHPPTDPVNALLSLGYTLALGRSQTLLAASDLDPLVGFLHDIRPGRPSLACDLIEPLRVPLVDRMVVSLLARRQLTTASFQQQGTAWRLQPGAFKEFVAAFEQAFHSAVGGPSWKDQTHTRIDRWSQLIRGYFSQDTDRGATS